MVKEKDPRVIVSVSVPLSLLRAITKLAQKQKMSLSKFMRQAAERQVQS